MEFNRFETLMREEESDDEGYVSLDPQDPRVSDLDDPEASYDATSQPSTPEPVQAIKDVDFKELLISMQSKFKSKLAMLSDSKDEDSRVSEEADTGILTALHTTTKFTHTHGL